MKTTQGIREDLITLQATSTFWFANLDGVDPQGARHVSPGQHIVIPRDRCPFYGNAANEIVKGTLKPPVEPAKTFVQMMVEKSAVLTSKAKDVISGPSVEGKFPCPVCGTVFTAQRGLDLHFRRTHEAAEV